MRQQHWKMRRLMTSMTLIQEIFLARSLPSSTRLVSNFCESALHKLSCCIQVCASLQAKAFFATMCHEEGLKPLELIKWICTRWGSMYDLIDHILTNCPVRYPVFYNLSSLLSWAS